MRDRVGNILSEYISKKSSKVFVAAEVWDKIVKRLDRKVENKAGGCNVKLRRADPNRGNWTFQVNCPRGGSGRAHVVKVKGYPKGSSNRLGSMPIEVTCDCEFWRWNGPDFNAKANDYLLGKPKSDGSAPNIRDPGRVFKVCKHVYSMLTMASDYKIREK